MSQNSIFVSDISPYQWVLWILKKRKSKEKKGKKKVKKDAKESPVVSKEKVAAVEVGDAAQQSPPPVRKNLKKKRA